MSLRGPNLGLAFSIFTVVLSKTRPKSLLVVKENSKKAQKRGVGSTTE
jgi:hypothetical protein